MKAAKNVINEHSFEKSKQALCNRVNHMIEESLVQHDLVDIPFLGVLIIITDLPSSFNTSIWHNIMGSVDKWQNEDVIVFKHLNGG
jgi:hypothetical protein